MKKLLTNEEIMSHFDNQYVGEEEKKYSQY